MDPKGKAITDKTFEAAGRAFEMDASKARQNTGQLIEKVEE